MTDEILKLARECGASVEQWMTTVPRPFAVHFELEALAKFAAAIRDEERSECAKVCEDLAKRRESGRSGYDDESRHNRTEGAIDELYFAAAAIRARG
jgi:hypothetical protein